MWRMMKGTSVGREMSLGDSVGRIEKENRGGLK